MAPLAKRLGLQIILIAAALLCCVAANAQDAMVYIHNGPESPLDKRYEYHWEILQTALERTIPKYGPYRFESAPYMSESRQTAELSRASGKLTVMFLGATHELEQKLTPVYIPVDKGLAGYFMLLTRTENEEKLRGVTTIDELKKFSFGLGADWIDNKVYQYNHFKVVTGSNYDGLFDMLDKKRFDVFPRSVVEVSLEYDERKHFYRNFTIDENILIHYPWPMYFWFERTAEGKKMAQRAREGMLAMFDDGSYDQIFNKYFKADIDRLNLKSRRLFSIENPELGPLTPTHDRRFWYVP